MLEKLFFREYADILDEDEIKAMDFRGPMLSQWETCGDHLYRQRGETARVVFFHRRKGVIRVLVGNSGRIHRFPGFADREEIKRRMWDGKLPQPKVRFLTTFEEASGGRMMMIWQVQPDGRYWEDEDGFGGEDGEEVCLYTYLDSRGRFTAPFRLYSVGGRQFRAEE